MITRRRFMQYVAASAGCSLLPLGGSAFALGNPGVATNKRLVVIMLRGAVDGLSVVVPYKDPGYYSHRTSIALKPPGQDGSVLDLDGSFGLHPALAPLMPYWKDKNLAFVHACGYPTNMRSHFEAQDIIETASLDGLHAHQGWMNGLIQVLPDTHSTMRALTFSNSLPKILSGSYNSVAMVPGNLKSDSKPAFENTGIEHEFDTLYTHDKRLNSIYLEAKQSRETMISDLKKEMIAANGGAPYPNGFPGQAARLAAMIKQDQSVQLAFIDLGGWDTHVNQGNAKGQLADRLKPLGEGLAALARELGPHYNETTIIVVSEFGRTVAENGNNGTDHGHGNVMWLMGGDVGGGKVWGRWPGLGANQLFEGRDLAVTTDFRSVIAEVMVSHFGLPDAKVRKAVPDFTRDAMLKGLITA